MKTQRIITNNQLDHDVMKNEIWVQGYCETIGNCNYINHRTLSSLRWQNMKKRALAISFQDFNSFVNWSRDQVGYCEKELNGRYWSIDKDILVSGNKTYSPETCIFVPNHVNAYLTNRRNFRGKLPLGVSLHKKNQRYVCHCSTGSGQEYLGCYDTALEAHRAWQINKIDTGLRLIQEYKNFHQKLAKGLEFWVNLFQSNYDNYQETKF